MKFPRINLETRTALIYLIVGCIWISLSDEIVESLTSNPKILTDIQHYKGWFFVAASALMIFLLLRRDLANQRAIQTNLNKQQEEYRFLFENNPFPMWIFDLDSLKFLLVNDSAVRKYGYSREEFSSMTILDIRPEEDLPKVMEGLQKGSESFQVTGPWKHRLKDGTIILVETSSHYLLYQGKRARFVMAQDITLRIKAEDNLRLQSTALNSAANAIVITDRESVIRWVNKSFEQLTGYSRQEAIGNTLMILKSGIQEDSFYEQIWSTARSGNVWHGELINKRKDGSLYAEEETLTPVFNSEGVITHYIAIKQDITERKQYEKLLYESEARLRLAATAAEQGIYDLNVQTGETVVSEIYARMLGYDPEVFIETNDKWLKRLHPDDRERVGKVFQDYISGKLPEYRVEFRQQTAQGDWVWILSVGSIVERDAHGQPLRMLGTHTNISEQKKAELEIARLLQESQRRLSRLASLREIDTAINSNNPLADTLNILLVEVKKQLHVDGVIILLFDEAQNIFSIAAHEGFHTPGLEGIQVSFEESLAGKAASVGEPVHLPCGDDIIGNPAKREIINREGYQSCYGIPLVARDKLKGVLELYSLSPVDQDEDWLGFFKTLAGQAALAIEKAQLIEGLQQANDDLLEAYDATIEGWSMAMDLRDRETEGHTERVTETTLALARKLNFSDDELSQIRRGALLHDIGKVGIPDAILLKPDTLTSEERQIIQQHPRLAFEMLKSVSYLRSALDIPHYHHEKWDGSGYPDGLKGEKIPFAARVFAIVDVYDALTSNRPYRPAWTKEATIQYIREQSGKHFDPAIVKVFIEYMEEKGE